MLQRLKHIKATKKRLKDGTVRTHYYNRRTGKKIHGEPGTPEFAASYARACEPDRSRALPGTFHALAENYLQSSEFDKLKPRTKKDYRRQADIILSEFANAPLAVFEDRRIRQDLAIWRDKIARESPRQADYAMAVLARILSFGSDKGLVGVNFAERMGRVYASDRSEKIWEDADIEAFLRHAPQNMALALRLALDTAQRQGDLIRLSWTQYQDGAIELRQNKGDKPIFVPCTELLRAELDQTPKRATTILTGRRGRPWTADGFRTEWYKVAVAAGIQGRLTFHDLRGTAVTRLAEAGSTVSEITAISGHSVSEVSSIGSPSLKGAPSNRSL